MNFIREVNSVKLVIGLGNPGSEYNNTRHNIGFMYLDYLYGDCFKKNIKFNALEYETIINNEKVIFIKPLSYMNLSGEVVIKYVNFYKINIDDVLVIQDDMDMDIGRYKLLFNHGDGGHNGIKDINNKLNSKRYLRLKIGISKRSDIDIKNFVLGKFSNDELKIVNDIFNNLRELINDYVLMDIDRLICKYNSKI